MPGKPLLIAILLSLYITATSTFAQSKHPNVILVMTDDQGYGDLACHGNKMIQTPNLDQLYGQSVRLTDFHVSPLCTPTRAGLMTGQNPVRVGTWGTTWGRSLPFREVATMADVFANSGYRTGCFGKWHLGDNFPFRPQDRGFQEVLVHGGGGVGQAPDFWGNDYFDDTYFRNGKPEKHQGYCTDIWFNAAIDFIETNKNEPFFAYVTTNAPHSPFLVAKQYSDYYAKNPNVPNAAFYGMITNIDENMGRLTKRLNELELAQDTILIFMTDNGTSAGLRGGKGFNAGMRGTKGSIYDGGHRVPFFIRWPKGNLTGGRNIDQLATHTDLLPTLIKLCDLKKPREAKFDGEDLASLLTGKANKLPDREIFVQFRQSTQPPEKWQGTVMTERWRLVGGKELYDINADPGQRKNIAGDHPEVVARLRQAYENWWADVSKCFDRYSCIVLGDNAENPTHLSSFDWHAKTAWSQHQVRNAMAINSFWAVEIPSDDKYEFTLRRWPAEADTPINDAMPSGKAIHADEARIKIGDLELTKPIRRDAKTVSFVVDLKPGQTKLQTWLTNKKTGKSWGAYYVDAKRLKK